MKFSATLVSIALALAGSAHGHAHVFRRGPSATFTPAPAPTTPPTVATPTGSTVKRGVSYNDANAPGLFGDKISWQYNWSPVPGGNVPAGKEFVPMLWGADADHTNGWMDDATAAIAAGATHLLGFNEPDLGAQSNLTPQQAAAAWRQWMEPFAGKAKLVSPAITNGGAPMGTAWLDSFLEECSDCTIDCIAMHIYDSATNIAYYQSYISNMASKYNKPVWVTEFGASGTTAQQTSFLQTMLPWLDAQKGVERYAYFMAGGNILVGTADSLLPLGTTYNTL
ncbi:glycoside hydrolase family 128 protein [Phanerochaete sordida]|uniref:Glycoside hydrolase family 128 protein n=1 Tax=Phanerochaete sordida TaxID=48140 RepID=A0A9P3GGQ8_9APHY|nr:glycoside hydrolase family 128 protein [Phanerochaete sordida]